MIIIKECWLIRNVNDALKISSVFEAILDVYVFPASPEKTWVLTTDWKIAWSFTSHISKMTFKGLLLSNLWIDRVNLQNRKNSSIRMACSIWVLLPDLIDSLLDVRQNVFMGVFAYFVTEILSCRNSGWKSLNIP